MKNVRTNKPSSLAMKVISVTAFVMGMMFFFDLQLLVDRILNSKLRRNLIVR
jgi:hypothetical protein